MPDVKIAVPEPGAVVPVSFSTLSNAANPPATPHADRTPTTWYVVSAMKRADETERALSITDTGMRVGTMTEFTIKASAGVTATLVENIFAPARVCPPVVTNPRAEVPASGILKVWVSVRDEMLKSLPEVPTINDCAPAVRESSDVTAAFNPADGWMICMILGSAFVHCVAR